MRTGWLYGAGVAVLALFTVLIFAVDLPTVLSTIVQVLWVALIFVLCLSGARDIRARRLRGRFDPKHKDGPAQPNDSLEGFDVRGAKSQGRLPEGPTI